MSRQPYLLLALSELPDDYSILRYHPSEVPPRQLLESDTAFAAVTRTTSELSVICPTRLVTATLGPMAIGQSQGWRCLRVELTSEPDETPGIVASVVGPLAAAGISAFAVATFDTDHVLVQDLEGAADALSQAGHSVQRHRHGTPAMTQAGTETGEQPEREGAAGVHLRDAALGDSSALAILADAATRRLVSWLWDSTTSPGQSSFEVGRASIRSDIQSTSHYSRWRVAELDGSLVGGLNSYQIVESAAATKPAPRDAVDVVGPVNELKSIAAGTWYVSVASVFPEWRGHGVGQSLLFEGERLAREAGVGQLTLLVASFNPRALSLYLRFGFREWERRTFRSFPGSDADGDWILLVKDIDDAGAAT